MKKYLFCVSLVLFIGICAGAIGATSCIVCADDSYGSAPSNCSSYVPYCLTDGTSFAVSSCDSCASGYKKQVASTSCGNITVYECVRDCSGCSNCTSDTTWSAGNTGFEKKIIRACNCNTCVASISYRCATGYYGSSTNGTTGCMSCKDETNNSYATSAAGSTAKTSCYIPASISLSDDMGAYTFTNNCYYTN